MKKKMVRSMMATGILAVSLLMTSAYAEGEKKTAVQEATTEETEQEDKEQIKVEELCGTYEGEKHIDAMNCDIRVEITLKEDGSYLYYRAPMNIAMNGGGEMPELKDSGTYEIDGSDLLLKGKELEEYHLTISEKEEEVYLEGKIPTGGPSTELTLEKAEEETETESESETETQGKEK